MLLEYTMPLVLFEYVTRDADTGKCRATVVPFDVNETSKEK